MPGYVLSWQPPNDCHIGRQYGHGSAGQFAVILLFSIHQLTCLAEVAPILVAWSTAHRITDWWAMPLYLRSSSHRFTLR